MSDLRVDWLRRRTTKCLEISNALFDDMYADKIHIDAATFSASLPNGSKPSDYGELELKHQLKAYGLSTKGNRDELEERYLDYLISTSRKECKKIIFSFFNDESCDTALIFHTFQCLKSSKKTLKLSIHCLPNDQINDGMQSIMYVIKSKAQKICIPNDCQQSALQIDDFMSLQCDHCILPGHSLLMLRRMIKNVYMPLLNDDNDELNANMNKFCVQISNAIQQVHGDIVLPLPSLPSNIGNNIESAMSAQIVSILETSLDEWSNIIHCVVTQCQEGIKNNCLRKRSQRKSSIFVRKSLICGFVTLHGPMSEINFWRNRNALLSGLWEQLIAEKFKFYIAVLERAKSSKINAFSLQLTELLHLYTETKDNVKFLATLERHFKNIESGNLQQIKETIPSMLNALRMVWIISRHYNTDERMLPLFDLIAIEISEKVAAKINICIITRYKSSKAMEIILSASELLKMWQSEYLKQRELIFESGTDHRWEFDRKLLFEQSNYTLTICNDLHFIAEVLGQFESFLGPKLKKVTKDIAEIDDLSQKVVALKSSLDNLPFNIFDRRYNASWQQMIKSFTKKVSEIEERCKLLIDTSFNKLRSAESAFDLLLDFKNLECRKSIKSKMMEKFEDILVQFGKEIALIDDIFEKEKECPPISKDMPQISGAIAWSRSLYARIKHVVIRFKEEPKLYESEHFKLIKAEYLRVAKKIDAYGQNLFDLHCKFVQETVDELLKEPILARFYTETQSTSAVNMTKSSIEIVECDDLECVQIENGQRVSSIICGSINRKRLLFGCLFIKSHKTKLRYDKMMNMDQRAMIDQNGNGHLSSNVNEMLYHFNSAILIINTKEHIIVQNSNKIFELIRECIFEWMRMHKKNEVKLNPISHRLSKYICDSLQEWLALNECMQIKVNFDEKLLCIARESKYLDRMAFQICDSAQKIYLQQSKFLCAIDKLQSMLNSYYAVISPLQYHERCAVRRAFKKLHFVLRPSFEHLNWNSLGIASFIEESVKAIQDFNGTVSRMKQSLLQIDKKIANISRIKLVQYNNNSKNEQRITNIDSLCRQISDFRKIQSDAMLIEYEGIIPLLGKIESVVVECESKCHPVLKELYQFVERQIFHALIAAIVDGCNALKDILQKKENLPLIQIEFLMQSAPEIGIIPRITDIHKSFSALLKSIISTALSFKRWQKNSCIVSCAIQIDEEEEECKLYTFYDDIKDDARVKNAFHSVSQIIQSAFTAVQNLVNEWRKYDSVYSLWDNRTLCHIERLQTSQALNVSYFERHIRPYFNLWQQCDDISIFSKIHFIQIDQSALICEVRKKSREWIDKYCFVLLNDASKELNAVNVEMSEFESNLYRKTDNIDQLQSVLSTIQSIQYSNMRMQLIFKSVIEKYRLLHNCKYDQITTEDELILKNIELRWKNLMFESKKRDIELLRVKEKFTFVTKELVKSFEKRTDSIKASFLSQGPDQNGIDLEKGVALMKEYCENLSELTAERAKLVNAQKLFGIEITVYPQLNFVESYMKKLQKLFDLYCYHQSKEKKWSDILWQELDVKVLEIGCLDSLNKLEKLDESLKDLNTFRKLSDFIESFQNSLPLLSCLKTDALRDRHWQSLMDLTGISFDVHSVSFTLGKLFKMKLHRFADKINAITYGAEQERKIERKLMSIKANWNKKTFPLHKYKKVSILGDTAEMSMDLEDDVLNLQTLLNSRFVVHFRSDVMEWDKNLNLVTECIKTWITVQQKWMYLEGIFVGSEDIRIQLKSAALAFDSVHNEFFKLMESVQLNPNAVRTCKMPKRLDDLKRLSSELDACQRSLSDYLESKRNAFPRFFFISDDELLSMLGTSDPTSVQQHMLKLFVNCKTLKFRGNNIIGMTSSEGEYFDFNEAVEARGKVEKWMNKVQSAMRTTLHTKAKEAVFHYPKSQRIEWIFSNLGMIGILGCQIWWTWQVEDAFNNVEAGDKNAMKVLNNKLTQQINTLVEHVRSKLSKKDRKKINTLIIIDVHARDIISRFVLNSILDSREFEWESQLRFYWDLDVEDVVIRQCTGSFRYGYEYMGLNGRLVITPLTDRCIMTLTQALTFSMGGAPAGPAGTGKTETVKDLAKSLAIPCFVTNCGEGLDYKAMGSIFSGLIQIGAWGCFDEFNRIELEVLSVVSTQLRILLDAIKCDVDSFEFLGRNISCDARCGFFITMNPGYAGRAELPDNLKSLFRPCTMIVPDMEQICEIMLFSEGFQGARKLAKKMCVLYKLSSEQLSKQYHYDFGLRALKSVLVMAGALKRGSDFGEDMTLMRALRDMNAPKFVYEDVPLFLQLINDLFPGLDCPRVTNMSLSDAICEDLNKQKYEINKVQIDKVVQLYETMLTRHTVMVVGPTQGGKSVVIETLARSHKSAFNKLVKIFRINPKAQTVSELYGVLDPVTREWTDGILSKLFRSMNQIPTNQKEIRWLLFDGDVDTMWVESMNSVMDDNKLLTLPNGERMMLQDHVKLLVEVYDLQYASPATISRCGMVYVDPKDLRYLPYFNKWIKNQNNEDEKAELSALRDKYLAKCLEFVFETKCKFVLPQCELNMIKQLCAIYNSISIPIHSLSDADIIESVFIFSLVWSIGGTLLSEDRLKFDDFLKKLSGRTLVSVAGKNKLPKEHTLYDFCFDLERFEWYPWSKQVGDYVPPKPFEFSKVMVPTIDTVRNKYFLDAIVGKRKKSLLFVGESGTAKTIIIENYLSTQCDPQRISTLSINFSSRTSSLDLQKNLMDNIEKRGPVYLPPSGKDLLVFIDDLNMPNVDLYGTQQPIALLKFLIERNKMYERDGDLEQICAKNMYWIAAMPPPGGGRNSVDSRFISLFNTLNVVFPSKTSLHRIYASILSEHVKNGFCSDVQMAATKITDITLSFYDSLVSALPATPSKFHYIFNLRDLSRIYEGLCLSVPSVYNDVDSFVRLYRNETLRIIYDRLICQKDKEFVDKQLLQPLIETNFCKTAKDINAICADPILFGDFGKENKMEIFQDFGASYDKIKDIFETYLAEYNEEFSSQQMNLVLFEDALEHLVRIHRILKRKRGNALLVGVGGSGKQSLCKLATFAANYKLFQISLTRSYGEFEFREDLKSLYIELGVNNKKCTFLLTDAHVTNEGFLELINNMLTSGMIPALFEEEEKMPLIESVRDKLPPTATKEDCWKFFVNQCRDNLHVVLAMSPNGDTLRRRCRNFPGMVSNCVIDWFFAWPKDALLAVANHSLPDADKQIIEHIVYVHLSVVQYSQQFEAEQRRKNHVTPKNYLDFLQNYKIQLSKFRDVNLQRIERLEGGLNQIKSATENVSKLKSELIEQNKVVSAASAECKKMIIEIQAKQSDASIKKEAATSKRVQLKLDGIEIAKEKKFAEDALEEALPALELAREALKNLKKEDIAEIKVLNNPKDCVKNVCLCVLGLRPSGTESISDGWSGARAMMGDAAFLSKLKNYPRDNMTESMYKKVNKILKSKPKDKAQALNMDNLKRVSSAGAGLLQWVIAMMRYYDVAKEVAPRRKKVQEMEKKMLAAQRSLSKTELELKELTASIKALSDNFNEKDSELKALTLKAEQMRAYLDSAAALIEGLGSERIRWTEDAAKLREKTDLLVGDCLLASSFLSYCGAFSFAYRHKMLYEDWANDIKERKIGIREGFKVSDLLITEVERSEWVSEGLPSDELSIQNGILTTRSSRYPLCIDPQMQAINWIKSRESKAQNSASLHIKNFSDSDFVKILELSVQFGNAFIFEGVDESNKIDPIIDALLLKQFVYSNNGKTKQIKIGDNLLDFDDSFRLYLVSKLSNPSYSPEVSGKTMIINFNVTLQGLEDQLLNVVVGHERPDLQKQREELIQTMSTNAILLCDLESLLLKELTSATGNILENKVLIKTLQDAKQKSIFIQQQLKESKTTSIKLNEVASSYRPAAKRGSILFFSLSSLSIISRMYEYSLSSYLDLFVCSLSTSRKDKNSISNRLNFIIDTLTKNVYNYVCSGIFERHKLMYSFKMATMINSHQIDDEQLSFFLRGNISLSEPKLKKTVDWISDAGWKDLTQLVEKFKFAQNLISDLNKKHKEWKLWYDLERPEDEMSKICNVENKLSQLLILRCFRPDRVYSAVRNYVICAMNDQYFVEPPVLEMSQIYASSSPNIPIVFILSAGADPMRELTKLAKQHEIVQNGKFKYLALGQGQAPMAESLLKMGASRGYWVVLQNCHLMPSWLQTLEKAVYDITKNKKINSNFRLWLTTDPTPSFPIGILQSSFKVVIEAPDGLKLNIRASFQRLSLSQIHAHQHKHFKPLVYVLSFFHAVVQERRKYGKLGWNVSYDFNESDYDTSLKLLSMYLDRADSHNKMPWQSLRYLIGEVMYGGRVTDSFDRRTLATYLDEYMGDFLFDSFQPFYFCKTTNFDYCILTELTQKAIDCLPISCGPEVFGLHSNAEIGYYTQSTNKLWADLISLQPRAAASTNASTTKNSDEHIADIAKSILSKLEKIDPFDIAVIGKKIRQKTSEFSQHLQPSSVVLLQELERWNKLVFAMKQSLNDLQRALLGEIGMSADLDSLSLDLFNGFLPKLWTKYAPATNKKLGSWMNHFLRRFKQYSDWIRLQCDYSPPRDPKVIWLSGLHIPETYLAALVQTTCRKNKWPLDKSTLFTKVTKYVNEEDVPMPSESDIDCCYVKGLYLEGAGWDYEQCCLCKQAAKQLVYQLPITQIIPMETNKVTRQNTFKTPVYVTSNRRNAMGVGLVFEADLATKQHESHWILQGTAITLNVAD